MFVLPIPVPEGAAAIATFQPDILISDIAMPEESGYELAERVKKLLLPKKPIMIALTGYGQAV